MAVSSVRQLRPITNVIVSGNDVRNETRVNLKNISILQKDNEIPRMRINWKINLHEGGLYSSFGKRNRHCHRRS